MPIVTGTAMWAYTKTADTKYEPCWRISVVMSDDEANNLKKLGLKVRRNDDGDFQFKFKRKVTNAKGSPNRQPEVVDANKEPLDVIIGNGSKVRVLFKLYTWKNSFGTGLGADLDKIQVLDLVPFEGGEEKEDFDDAPPATPAAPASSGSDGEEW